MDFIYGLAVLLVLFEGIKIPCEVAGGNGAEAEDSSNLRQDGPTNNNKNDGSFQCEGASDLGGPGDAELETEISDDEYYFIIFPNVEVLEIQADCDLKHFKLDQIYPKLHSLSLNARVADVNCLDNVKYLKELLLDTTSIPEDKLGHIFQNNKHMTKIYLLEPKNRETMQSIADNLKELRTLEVKEPGKHFLSRAKGDPVCVLPNVERFVIICDEMDKILPIENPSFAMPKMQKLTLKGFLTDNNLLVNFIEHFKELNKVEIFETATNFQYFKKNLAKTWTIQRNGKGEDYGYLELSKYCKK